MPSEKKYDYSDFKEEVIKKNRFFLSQEAIVFLERLKRKARSRELLKGDVLYRSVAHEKPIDQDSYRMEPLGDCRIRPFENMYNQESEGRVNPSNIHCLYLSDSAIGALAESRPEIGRPATVAKLQAVRNLKIVDFSIPPYTDASWYAYFSEDTWQYSKAFSTPLMAFESRLGYVPTQIIAEYFKSEGFDGICYKSQFKHFDESQEEVDSLNYALFDLEAAEIIPNSKKVLKIKAQYIKYEEV